MRMTAPPDSPGRLDDATLIEQSRHRPESFATLYDRHFGDIYRYVAARIGPQAADDLASETFLVAFRKRDGFDPERGAVRRWLYGIATNLLADHRRSETRRLEALARVPVDSPAESEHADRVAAQVTAAATQRRLAAELSRLPDGERDVLLLVAYGDLSYEEIAQALDIPLGTVGSRLNRVRRKLRAALNDITAESGGSDG
ncbi:RNA polymerase sigma factor [Streptosporangium sandarakinum]|uniref:RNA polymerase sigma-70 factor (ECF subfamily) n=1 Tax=Streptosporangium sandarakinum TaxID=1260955 RepID=A0A852V6C5_9ACTN|nr:RNA polymerase sigma factor [Streptosporangium sandarakinum]NYF43128.1 RNA polymerase sigma-70 factor (ECF subfamily) [Streptosporangium sandarakinum]